MLEQVAFAITVLAGYMGAYASHAFAWLAEQRQLPSEGHVQGLVDLQTLRLVGSFTLQVPPSSLSGLACP